MLGREIVERQQVGAVFGQAFDSPVVFHAISLDEEIEGGVGFGFGLGHPDILQMRLGFRLHGLGQRIEHVRCLVDPAALHPGLAVNLMERGPEAHGAIADGQLGRDLQPPAFRFADLRFRSSSSSRQLWGLSRKPQVRPSTSLLPHSSAPIITSLH